MSFAFISYKREDELPVGRIAQALAAEGVEVWWDRGLPGGESWHSNIESKLNEAGCVVVVWSAASAGPDGGYVREEARRGLSRNILVPVLIDRLSELPLGFGEIQAIELSHWRGDRKDPFFQDLLATVRAKLANTPLPVSKGPGTRVRRRLVWGGLSAAGLLTSVLFVFNTFSMASALCTLPGPQPGLSDGCGAMGLGNRPSRSEREAWESRAPASCAALREHISRFPGGVYRSQAADLLAARRTTVRESWTPVVKPLSLFEPAQGVPAKDQLAAQTQALTRAQASAERVCRDFGAGTLYHYRSAQPRAESWSCESKGGGTRCGFEGHAECQLDERHEAESESCG
jgi:hypothetical protein